MRDSSSRTARSCRKTRAVPSFVRSPSRVFVRKRATLRARHLRWNTFPSARPGLGNRAPLTRAIPRIEARLYLRLQPRPSLLVSAERPWPAHAHRGGQRQGHGADFRTPPYGIACLEVQRVPVTGWAKHRDAALVSPRVAWPLPHWPCRSTQLRLTDVSCHYRIPTTGTCEGWPLGQASEPWSAGGRPAAPGREPDAGK